MNGYAWSATVIAGLAGFLAPTSSARVVAARRLGWSPKGSSCRGRPSARRYTLAAIGAGGLAAIGLASWFGPVVLVAGMLPAAVIPAGARARRSWQTRARAVELGRSACEACEVMAAELRAGRSPAQALDAGATVLPALAPAAAAAVLGGDVVTALHNIEVPGSRGLRPLAAAWAVAETGGAGLAVVIDRLAAGMREEAGIRDEVRAALAAPRSTARVLAALPLAGIALGYAMGSDPLAFLVGTPVGVGCLAAGACLALAGLAWVEHLARSAEDRP